MRSMSPEPLPPAEPMFASREPERPPFNAVPWAIAGVVVLGLIAVLVLAGRGRPALPPNAVLPLDPYAANLAFSPLQMSQAESLSGGKSTYIDGRVKNLGTKTVTGATVQVLFANSLELPPQVETLALALIRTHEPYVDTEPISAEPLAPGDEKEFRLIFEDINSNWNQQVPEIHITKVNTR